MVPVNDAVFADFGSKSFIRRGQCDKHVLLFVYNIHACALFGTSSNYQPPDWLVPRILIIVCALFGASPNYQPPDWLMGVNDMHRNLINKSELPLLHILSLEPLT